MRLAWMFIAAALLLPGLALAKGSPDKLAKAKSAYEDGDYPKASSILQEMFRSSDLTAEELRQAHMYLAASYFYMQKEPLARKEFDALFRESPYARVDPVLFPPEIVEMANEEAKKLEAEQDQERSRPPPAAPVPEVKPKPTPPVVVAQEPQAHLDNRTSTPSAATAPLASRATPPSVGYSFIPFGVGQFANEQYGKGALFLSLEVLAVVTFATSSALAESLKSGGVPFFSYTLANPNNQSEFNRDETIYIVAFWTGLGIYAVGVIESLIPRPSQEELDARHGVASVDLGSGLALQLAPTGAVMRF